MIRRMEVEDIDRVCQIEQENFSMPWSKQGFLDAYNQKDTLFLIIEDNAHILGYCGAYLVCGEAEITNVSVTRKRQGEQIGSLLLEHFLETLQELGLEAVTLEVRKSNQAAIHLYEKYGFVQEGIRPGFYEKPLEDACIMWKR